MMVRGRSVIEVEESVDAVAPCGASGAVACPEASRLNEAASIFGSFFASLLAIFVFILFKDFFCCFDFVFLMFLLF